MKKSIKLILLLFLFYGCQQGLQTPLPGTDPGAVPGTEGPASIPETTSAVTVENQTGKVITMHLGFGDQTEISQVIADQGTAVFSNLDSSVYYNAWYYEEGSQVKTDLIQYSSARRFRFENNKFHLITLYQETHSYSERRISSLEFNLTGTLGMNAVSPGRLREPEAIVVYGDFLYVADTDNHRIQKLDKEGNHISTICTTLGPFQSSDPSGFRYPRDLTFDSMGNLYVLDSQNERVQVFSSEGIFIRKFGSAGTFPGGFDFPKGLAVDDSGYVYIADTGNKRIQKLTSAGQHIWTVTAGNHASTDNQEPSSIEVYNNKIHLLQNYDTVYVTYNLDGSGETLIETSGYKRLYKDSSCLYILKMAYDGTTVEQYDQDVLIKTTSLTGLEITSDVESFTVDASGNFYLVNKELNLIHIFNSSGMHVKDLGNDSSLATNFNEPWYMDVDNNDNLYIADSWNHSVKKYSAEGTYVRSIGGVTHGDDQVNHPSGVTFSSQSQTIFIIGGQIPLQEFTTDGTWVRKIDHGLPWPAAVASDDQGNFYLSDTNDHLIRKISPEGSVLTTWGQYGSLDDGYFYYPSGMDVHMGEVFITDKLNGKVKIYTDEGVFIKTAPIADEEFPVDVDRDSQGNYYFLQENPSLSVPAVVVYDSSFNYLGEFGYRGNGPGELMTPKGLVIDSRDTIYISDGDRWDVQIFKALESVRTLSPLRSERDEKKIIEVEKKR